MLGMLVTFHIFLYYISFFTSFCLSVFLSSLLIFVVPNFLFSVFPYVCSFYTFFSDSKCVCLFYTFFRLHVFHLSIRLFIIHFLFHLSVRLFIPYFLSSSCFTSLHASVYSILSFIFICHYFSMVLALICPCCSFGSLNYVIFNPKYFST
jgi:hypothetical protein